MNAKQKIHQSNLAEWAVRFKEQTASGLTVKIWCEKNGYSIHTFKHADAACSPSSCLSAQIINEIKLNILIFYFHLLQSS